MNADRFVKVSSASLSISVSNDSGMRRRIDGMDSRLPGLSYISGIYVFLAFEVVGSLVLCQFAVTLILAPTNSPGDFIFRQT